MIKAQGGIFGWVSDSARPSPRASTPRARRPEQGDRHGRRQRRRRPKLWTPGDWNALFGFGTNILVNLLVLTGPAAVRAADADRHRLRPHPARARADDVPLDRLLRVARLPASQEDRARRRLRAALGHLGAAHVRRHLRDHAADRDRDRRPDQGLGGRPRLGVLPELHPDDRRLRRALHPPRHAACGAARHAGGRLDRLHLDAPGARDVHDAGDRRRLPRDHPRRLVRRRALSARHPGRACRHRLRHAGRLGLGGARARRSAA